MQKYLRRQISIKHQANGRMIAFRRVLQQRSQERKLHDEGRRRLSKLSVEQDENTLRESLSARERKRERVQRLACNESTN